MPGLHRTRDESGERPRFAEGEQQSVQPESREERRHRRANPEKVGDELRLLDAGDENFGVRFVTGYAEHGLGENDPVVWSQSRHAPLLDPRHECPRPLFVTGFIGVAPCVNVEPEPPTPIGC